MPVLNRASILRFSTRFTLNSRTVDSLSLNATINTAKTGSQYLKIEQNYKFGIFLLNNKNSRPEVPQETQTRTSVEKRPEN
jgi:hypothetical protein